LALAFPGDFLGYSEEFVAGEGTVEQDGSIFAVALGEKQVDDSGRRVSIKAAKFVRPLAKGDIVYGKIQDLYDTVALIEFQPLNAPSTFPAAESRNAFLRISEITSGYVEKLEDYMRIGDYVRAQVLEVKSLGIYLTMKAPDLGVVKAICSYCRGGMDLKGKDFVCSRCGSIEQRKLPHA
jgi:exosome complex component CSL4